VTKTLLIIDDEILLAENLKEFLEEEAETIYIAINAQEGLKILESQIIDCVISDVNMPLMGGLQLIEESRKRGHKMPFVFYTGHGDDDLKRKAAQLGAHDLIVKPNLHVLEETIRNILKSMAYCP
jgi:YesN/AraC family two-component response regulator